MFHVMDSPILNTVTLLVHVKTLEPLPYLFHSISLHLQKTHVRTGASFPSKEKAEMLSLFVQIQPGL